MLNQDIYYKKKINNMSEKDFIIWLEKYIDKNEHYTAMFQLTN